MLIDLFNKVTDLNYILRLIFSLYNYKMLQIIESKQ